MGVITYSCLKLNTGWAYFSKYIESPTGAEIKVGIEKQAPKEGDLQRVPLMRVVFTSSSFAWSGSGNVTTISKNLGAVSV